MLSDCLLAQQDTEQLFEPAKGQAHGCTDTCQGDVTYPKEDGVVRSRVRDASNDEARDRLRRTGHNASSARLHMTLYDPILPFMYTRHMSMAASHLQFMSDANRPGDVGHSIKAACKSDTVLP